MKKLWSLVLLVAASLAMMGQQFSGPPRINTPLSQAVFDDFADDSDRVGGNRVWGHYIKTQAELIQPIVVRVDDVGARDSTGVIIQQALVNEGLKVSACMNAFSLAGGSVDSTLLSAMLVAASAAGVLNNLEWIQHTNSNMDVDIVTSLGQHSDGANGDWTDFYDWTWEMWEKELDKSFIVARVNGISAAAGLSYRISASDIRGIVWPGDASPDRRAFIEKNIEMFNALIDHLDYDYALTGAAEGQIYRNTAITSAAATPAASSQFTPFCFANSYRMRGFLPYWSTMDLSSDLIVERGATAKVPWSPASVSEFTLAQHTNYYDGVGTAYTDYGTYNTNLTFRFKVARDFAFGAGHCGVFHDEWSSITDATNLTYGDGLTADQLELTRGESVNGGANWHRSSEDFEYCFAFYDAAIDSGLAQAMTVTEHVKWLASKPGAPGLMVAGWIDPRILARDIGDTVGVDVDVLIGGGQIGSANVNMTADTVLDFGEQIQDTDFDGKNEVYGTGATARLLLVDGLGPRGSGDERALMLEDDNQYHSDLSFAWTGLPPGQYMFSMAIQSANGYRTVTTRNPTLFVSGWTHTPALNTGGNNGVYGELVPTLLTFTEKVLGPASTSVYALETNQAGTTTGTTDFGDDAWPGATPDARTKAGWHYHRIFFTVPDEVSQDATYTPLVSNDVAQITDITGAFRWNVEFESEDRIGGAGLEEHTRIGPTGLYWLGPN